MCLFHTSYCLPRLPFHCLLLSRPSLFQQHVLPYHSVSYITPSSIQPPSVANISRIFYFLKVHGLTNFVFLVFIYLFVSFFFQSYRFNILIDKIEKREQNSKFAHFLNFNGFIISGFLSVATVKLKYDAILSDNFGRRIIFV